MSYSPENPTKAALWIEHSYVRLGLQGWLRAVPELEIVTPTFEPSPLSYEQPGFELIIVDLMGDLFHKLHHLRALTEYNDDVLVAALWNHVNRPEVDLDGIDLLIGPREQEKNLVSLLRQAHLKKQMKNKARQTQIKTTYDDSWGISELESGQRLKISIEQPKVNKTELHFLQLASKGFENSAIAKAMNKSKRTVEGYRVRLKRKLECRGFEEVIAKAVRWGWI